MKEKIKFYLCIFACLFIWLMTGVSANAEETTEDDSHPDGWIMEGYVHNTWLHLVYNVNYHEEYEFSCSDFCLYLLRNVDSYILMSGPFNDRYTLGSVVISDRWNVQFKDGDDMPSHSAGVYHHDIFSSSQSCVYVSGYVENGKMTSFDTNLPIFDIDDVESINNYINYGDTSGSLNEIDKPEHDLDVELPRNLVSRGSWDDHYQNAQNNGKGNRVTFQWSCPTVLDGYSYDVKLKMSYKTTLTGGVYSTDTCNFVTNYPYETGSWIDINTGLPVSRSPDTPESFYVDIPRVNELFNKCGMSNPPNPYFVVDFTFYVRNRKDNKCSSWVKVGMNLDGSTNADVVDDDDNPTDEEEYDGSITEPNVPYHPDIPGIPDIPSSFDISGITAFIRSGFGLIGSGGLISLMSSVFSYIPASVWDLIKMAVSTSILIMIIGLIKNLVFG